MKIFSALTIAAAAAFASELAARYLLRMIPGSVIGIILMTILLYAKVIKYDAISEVSGFFLDNIVFFLIPVVVSSAQLSRYAGGFAFKIIILITAGTIIVMVVTGISAQLLTKLFYRDKSRKTGTEA